MLGLRLTKLMVVGEAKTIHVALAGDGKGEVGTTEGILESHMTPASSGFQHHALGDQESLCRQTGGQGQWQTQLLSALCVPPHYYSPWREAKQGFFFLFPIKKKRKLRPREYKCLTQTPRVVKGNIYMELSRCQTFFYVNSFHFTTTQ